MAISLTSDRNTPRRGGEGRLDPVAAGSRIFGGAIVLLDAAGNAVADAVGASLKAVGRARAIADNRSGLAADKYVESESGVFGYDAHASINRSHIGKAVYVADDHTVRADNAGATLTATVILCDLQGSIAWVRLGL